MLNIETVLCTQIFGSPNHCTVLSYPELWHCKLKSYSWVYICFFPLLASLGLFICSWTSAAHLFINLGNLVDCGPGSSVGIATGNRLDGPRIESQWRRDFPHLSRPTLGAPPSFLYNGFRVFPGGKKRPGRDTDPSPPSSAVVMKG